jgi:signal transduction histidine kinase
VYSDAVELARERFVDMLGHDLRGPLSVVLMAAGSLVRADGADTGTTKKLGTRIARNATRMAGMIEDLLDFARGKRGQGIPVELAPADMGDICRAAIDELAFANPGRAVAFVGEGDLRGEWDADRVTQAISNLVSNALVHGEDPVRVVARAHGDDVFVAVENRGKPIDPQRLATIFEPYQALATEAQARTRVGLGLGLFIVREVVRSHGGGVEVTSDANATVFSTRWPRHPGARPANEAPSPSPGPA